MNDASNEYPDSSCVNFLLTDLPQNQGNGPWAAAPLRGRWPPSSAPRTNFGFSYQIGSDVAAANTGDANNIAYLADNTTNANGWSPFYMDYAEDTYTNFAVFLMASASTATVTCVLTVNTPIDMIVSSFFLRSSCS